MNKNIFITGATGFLGSYLLKEILENSNANAYLLVRSFKRSSAHERTQETLYRLFKREPNKDIMKRIFIFEGDVSNENLDLEPKNREYLNRTVNEIFHCAAVARLRQPLDIMRRSNVYGAENVLKFALQCRNLNKVNHISTTFIAGTKAGEFTEDDLDVGQKFNNSYEQSKFEAELLVRDYRKKGLPISVFRPSLITGTYNTGETSSFKMIYEPLHLFSREIFKKVPADVKCLHNLIPVDVVVKAIFLLATKENRVGCYHIISPEYLSLGRVFNLASDFFGYRNPEFISLNDFNIKRLTYVQKELLRPFIPYFNYKTLFDGEATITLLKEHNFIFPVLDDAFLLRLFKFSNQKGFIKTAKTAAIL